MPGYLKPPPSNPTPNMDIQLKSEELEFITQKHPAKRLKNHKLHQFYLYQISCLYVKKKPLNLAMLRPLKVDFS
ncbi:MAG: hypothetical protein MIO92_02475, partial [Methanosarcinaceae archaeon]|nr:hypothetical protein [Methanosarcinaceae archaeon]